MECELWAYTADDKACPPCSQWGMFLFDNGERHDRKTSIFTDRAIYRPGQTVHVAVVRYRTTRAPQPRPVPASSSISP